MFKVAVRSADISVSRPFTPLLHHPVIEERDSRYIINLDHLKPGHFFRISEDEDHASVAMVVVMRGQDIFVESRSEKPITITGSHSQQSLRASTVSELTLAYQQTIKKLALKAPSIVREAQSYIKESEDTIDIYLQDINIGESVKIYDENGKLQFVCERDEERIFISNNTQKTLCFFACEQFENLRVETKSDVRFADACCASEGLNVIAPQRLVSFANGFSAEKKLVLQCEDLVTAHESELPENAYVDVSQWVFDEGASLVQASLPGEDDHVEVRVREALILEADAEIGATDVVWSVASLENKGSFHINSTGTNKFANTPLVTLAEVKQQGDMRIEDGLMQIVDTSDEEINIDLAVLQLGGRLEIYNEKHEIQAVCFHDDTGVHIENKSKRVLSIVAQEPLTSLHITSTADVVLSGEISVKETLAITAEDLYINGHLQLVKETDILSNSFIVVDGATVDQAVHPDARGMAKIVAMESVQLSSTAKVTTTDVRWLTTTFKNEGQFSVNGDLHYVNSQEHHLPQGLSFFAVAGDGNCMFAAVAKQVGLDAKTLRAQVVDYLQDHELLYSAYMTEPFAQYVEKMSKNGTWGGHIELDIMQKMLNRRIAIFSTSPSKAGYPQVIGHDQFCENPPIALVYNGINHYNGLKVDEGYDASEIFNDALKRHQQGEKFFYSWPEPLFSATKVENKGKVTVANCSAESNKWYQEAQALYVEDKANLTIGEFTLAENAQLHIQEQDQVAKMDQHLPEGLEFFKVQADKHCLFRAVATLFNMDHLLLRQHLALYLRDNKARFYRDKEKFHHFIIEDYDKRLNQIAEGSVWPDAFELNGLQQMFDCRIAIFHTNARQTNYPKVIGHDQFCKNPPIALVSDGIQYNGLRVREGVDAREMFNDAIVRHYQGERFYCDWRSYDIDDCASVNLGNATMKGNVVVDNAQFSANYYQQRSGRFDLRNHAKYVAASGGETKGDKKTYFDQGATLNVEANSKIFVDELQIKTPLSIDDSQIYAHQLTLDCDADIGESFIHVDTVCRAYQPVSSRQSTWHVGGYLHLPQHEEPGQHQFARCQMQVTQVRHHSKTLYTDETSLIVVNQDEKIKDRRIDDYCADVSFTNSAYALSKNEILQGQGKLLLEDKAKIESPKLFAYGDVVAAKRSLIHAEKQATFHNVNPRLQASALVVGQSAKEPDGSLELNAYSTLQMQDSQIYARDIEAPWHVHVEGQESQFVAKQKITYTSSGQVRGGRLSNETLAADGEVRTDGDFTELDTFVAKTAWFTNENLHVRKKVQVEASRVFRNNPFSRFSSGDEAEINAPMYLNLGLVSTDSLYRQTVTAFNGVELGNTLRHDDVCQAFRGVVLPRNSFKTSTWGLDSISFHDADGEFSPKWTWKGLTKFVSQVCTVGRTAIDVATLGGFQYVADVTTTSGWLIDKFLKLAEKGQGVHGVYLAAQPLLEDVPLLKEFSDVLLTSLSNVMTSEEYYQQFMHELKFMHNKYKEKRGEVDKQWHAFCDNQDKWKTMQGELSKWWQEKGLQDVARLFFKLWNYATLYQKLLGGSTASEIFFNMLSMLIEKVWYSGDSELTKEQRDKCNDLTRAVVKFFAAVQGSSVTERSALNLGGGVAMSGHIDSKSLLNLNYNSTFIGGTVNTWGCQAVQDALRLQTAHGTYYCAQSSIEGYKYNRTYHGMADVTFKYAGAIENATQPKGWGGRYEYHNTADKGTSVLTANYNGFKKVVVKGGSASLEGMQARSLDTDLSGRLSADDVTVIDDKDGSSYLKAASAQMAATINQKKLKREMQALGEQGKYKRGDYEQIAGSHETADEIETYAATHRLAEGTSSIARETSQNDAHVEAKNAHYEQNGLKYHRGNRVAKGGKFIQLGAEVRDENGRLYQVKVEGEVNDFSEGTQLAESNLSLNFSEREDYDETIERRTKYQSFADASKGEQTYVSTLSGNLNDHSKHAVEAGADFVMKGGGTKAGKVTKASSDYQGREAAVHVMDTYVLNESAFGSEDIMHAMLNLKVAQEQRDKAVKNLQVAQAKQTAEPSQQELEQIHKLRSEVEEAHTQVQVCEHARIEVCAKAGVNPGEVPSVELSVFATNDYRQAMEDLELAQKEHEAAFHAFQAVQAEQNEQTADLSTEQVVQLDKLRRALGQAYDKVQVCEHERIEVCAKAGIDPDNVPSIDLAAKFAIPVYAERMGVISFSGSTTEDMSLRSVTKVVLAENAVTGQKQVAADEGALATAEDAVEHQQGNHVAVAAPIIEDQLTAHGSSEVSFTAKTVITGAGADNKAQHFTTAVQDHYLQPSAQVIPQNLSIHKYHGEFGYVHVNDAQLGRSADGRKESILQVWQANLTATGDSYDVAFLGGDARAMVLVEGDKFDAHGEGRVHHRHTYRQFHQEEKYKPSVRRFNHADTVTVSAVLDDASTLALLDKAREIVQAKKVKHQSEFSASGEGEVFVYDQDRESSVFSCEKYLLECNKLQIIQSDIQCRQNLTPFVQAVLKSRDDLQQQKELLSKEKNGLAQEKELLKKELKRLGFLRDISYEHIITVVEGGPGALRKRISEHDVEVRRRRRNREKITDEIKQRKKDIERDAAINRCKGLLLPLALNIKAQVAAVDKKKGSVQAAQKSQEQCEADFSAAIQKVQEQSEALHADVLMKDPLSKEFDLESIFITEQDLENQAQQKARVFQTFKELSAESSGVHDQSTSLLGTYDVNLVVERRDKVNFGAKVNKKADIASASSITTLPGAQAGGNHLKLFAPQIDGNGMQTTAAFASVQATTWSISEDIFAPAQAVVSVDDINIHYGGKVAPEKLWLEHGASRRPAKVINKGAYFAPEGLMCFEGSYADFLDDDHRPFAFFASGHEGKLLPVGMEGAEFKFSGDVEISDIIFQGQLTEFARGAAPVIIGEAVIKTVSYNNDHATVHVKMGAVFDRQTKPESCKDYGFYTGEGEFAFDFSPEDYQRFRYDISYVRVRGVDQVAFLRVAGLPANTIDTDKDRRFSFGGRGGRRSITLPQRIEQLQKRAKDENRPEVRKQHERDIERLKKQFSQTDAQSGVVSTINLSDDHFSRDPDHLFREGLTVEGNFVFDEFGVEAIKRAYPSMSFGFKGTRIGVPFCYTDTAPKTVLHSDEKMVVVGWQGNNFSFSSSAGLVVKGPKTTAKGVAEFMAQNADITFSARASAGEQFVIKQSSSDGRAIKIAHGVTITGGKGEQHDKIGLDIYGGKLLLEGSASIILEKEGHGRMDLFCIHSVPVITTRWEKHKLGVSHKKGWVKKMFENSWRGIRRACGTHDEYEIELVHTAALGSDDAVFFITTRDGDEGDALYAVHLKNVQYNGKSDFKGGHVDYKIRKYRRGLSQNRDKGTDNLVKRGLLEGIVSMEVGQYCTLDISGMNALCHKLKTYALGGEVVTGANLQSHEQTINRTHIGLYFNGVDLSKAVFDMANTLSAGEVPKGEVKQFIKDLAQKDPLLGAILSLAESESWVEGLVNGSNATINVALEIQNFISAASNDKLAEHLKNRGIDLKIVLTQTRKTEMHEYVDPSHRYDVGEWDIVAEQWSINGGRYCINELNTDVSTIHAKALMAKHRVDETTVSFGMGLTGTSYSFNASHSHSSGETAHAAMLDIGKWRQKEGHRVHVKGRAGFDVDKFIGEQSADLYAVQGQFRHSHGSVGVTVGESSMSFSAGGGGGSTRMLGGGQSFMNIADASETELGDVTLTGASMNAPGATMQGKLVKKDISEHDESFDVSLSASHQCGQQAKKALSSLGTIGLGFKQKSAIVHSAFNVDANAAQAVVQREVVSESKFNAKVQIISIDKEGCKQFKRDCVAAFTRDGRQQRRLERSISTIPYAKLQEMSQEELTKALNGKVDVAVAKEKSRQFRMSVLMQHSKEELSALSPAALQEKTYGHLNHGDLQQAADQLTAYAITEFSQAQLHMLTQQELDEKYRGHVDLESLREHSEQYKASLLSQIPRDQLLRMTNAEVLEMSHGHLNHDDLLGASDALLDLILDTVPRSSFTHTRFCLKDMTEEQAVQLLGGHYTKAQLLAASDKQYAEIMMQTPERTLELAAALGKQVFSSSVFEYVPVAAVQRWHQEALEAQDRFFNGVVDFSKFMMKTGVEMQTFIVTSLPVALNIAPAWMQTLHAGAKQQLEQKSVGAYQAFNAIPQHKKFEFVLDCLAHDVVTNGLSAMNSGLLALNQRVILPRLFFPAGKAGLASFKGSYRLPKVFVERPSCVNIHGNGLFSCVKEGKGIVFSRQSGRNVLHWAGDVKGPTVKSTVLPLHFSPKAKGPHPYTEGKLYQPSIHVSDTAFPQPKAQHSYNYQPFNESSILADSGYIAKIPVKPIGQVGAATEYVDVHVMSLNPQHVMPVPGIYTSPYQGDKLTTVLDHLAESSNPVNKLAHRFVDQFTRKNHNRQLRLYAVDRKNTVLFAENHDITSCFVPAVVEGRQELSIYIKTLTDKNGMADQLVHVRDRLMHELGEAVHFDLRQQGVLSDSCVDDIHQALLRDYKLAHQDFAGRNGKLKTMNDCGQYLSDQHAMAHELYNRIDASVETLQSPKADLAREAFADWFKVCGKYGVDKVADFCPALHGQCLARLEKSGLLAELNLTETFSTIAKSDFARKYHIAIDDLIEAMQVPSAQARQYIGMPFFHGTDNAPGVLEGVSHSHSSKKVVVGSGLYAAMPQDVELANGFTRQQSPGGEPVLMEGRITKPLRIGKCEIVNSIVLPRITANGTVLLPKNWAKIPELQKYMQAHFDMLIIGGDFPFFVESEGVLLLHEGANDAIQWKALRQPLRHKYKRATTDNTPVIASFSDAVKHGVKQGVDVAKTQAKIDKARTAVMHDIKQSVSISGSGFNVVVQIHKPCELSTRMHEVAKHTFIKERLLAHHHANRLNFRGEISTKLVADDMQDYMAQRIAMKLITQPRFSILQLDQPVAEDYIVSLGQDAKKFSLPQQAQVTAVLRTAAYFQPTCERMASIEILAEDNALAKSAIDVLAFLNTKPEAQQLLRLLLPQSGLRKKHVFSIICRNTESLALDAGQKGFFEALPVKQGLRTKTTGKVHLAFSKNWEQEMPLVMLHEFHHEVCENRLPALRQSQKMRLLNRLVATYQDIVDNCKRLTPKQREIVCLFYQPIQAEVDTLLKQFNQSKKRFVDGFTIPNKLVEEVRAQWGMIASYYGAAEAEICLPVLHQEMQALFDGLLASKSVRQATHKKVTKTININDIKPKQKTSTAKKAQQQPKTSAPIEAKSAVDRLFADLKHQNRGLKFNELDGIVARNLERTARPFLPRQYENIYNETHSAFVSNTNIDFVRELPVFVARSRRKVKHHILVDGAKIPYLELKTYDPNTPCRIMLQDEYSTTARFIYVVKADGQLVISTGMSEDPRQGVRVLHHDEIASGDNVLDAGEFIVNFAGTEGKINVVNNQSGHYLPCAVDGKTAVNAFKKYGFAEVEEAIYRKVRAPTYVTPQVASYQPGHWSLARQQAADSAIQAAAQRTAANTTLAAPGFFRAAASHHVKDAPLSYADVVRNKTK